jgi:hypothetical protein
MPSIGSKSFIKALALANTLALAVVRVVQVSPDDISVWAPDTVTAHHSTLAEQVAFIPAVTAWKT